MPYAKHNLSAFKEYRDLLAEIERLRAAIKTAGVMLDQGYSKKSVSDYLLIRVNEQ